MNRAIVFALLCLAAVGALAGGSGAGAQTGGTQSDATYVVYTRYLENDRLEVWIAHVDGSGKRRLAAGRSPQISPDGRWVVFRGGCDMYGDCRRLYLIASAGGRPRLVARGGSGTLWSPDSRFVLFVNGSGITRFEVATGQLTPIARGNVQSSWGWTFSPTGDEIAYTVARHGRCFGDSFDIYLVGISGGTSRRLTTDGCSAFPVWGPAGIAYARLISYRGWGRHEIWRINPDGSRRHTITGRVPERFLGQGITGLVPIAWSNDGRHLLTGLVNEFGAVPFAVDPKRGAAIRKIGNYNYADRPDGLSRDGRSVLVSVGNVASYDGTRVEIVPYTGGRGRVIARRAGEASWNL